MLATTVLAALPITFLHQDVDVTNIFTSQAWIKPHTDFYSNQESLSITDVHFTTAKEIASWLRDEGLPIAIIAEISNVERKTIYSWLSGGPAKDYNIDRLNKIYILLNEKKQADLRNLYRLWNRPVIDKKPLKILFSEKKLDILSIKQTLTALWPIAKKNMELDKLHPVKGDIKDNPFLMDIPDVSSNDNYEKPDK